MEPPGLASVWEDHFVLEQCRFGNTVLKELTDVFGKQANIIVIPAD